MLDFHLLKSSIDWKCWSVYWVTSCEDVTRIAAPGTWTILLLNRTCFPPRFGLLREHFPKHHLPEVWRSSDDTFQAAGNELAKCCTRYEWRSLNEIEDLRRGASVFSRRRAHPFPFLVGAIPTHDQCITRTGGQNHWILCRGRPPTGFEIVSFICPMSVVFVLVMASKVKQF